jgi:hypothetical protein
MHIEKYRNSRAFALYDDEGTLVCVTLYRKGAQEVMQRLQARNGTPPEPPAADDHLPTDATRRRWRRALAIAAILFEQDGYHSRYLHELSQFVARLPGNGAAPQPTRREQAEQYCNHCQCWRPELGTGACQVCGQDLEPF